MTTRSGIGVDVHPLTEARALVLGGVNIPFGKGLAGHSDGDALTHAIIDAMLGAAALGDIGTHFRPATKSTRASQASSCWREPPNCSRGIIGASPLLMLQYLPSVQR